MPGARTNGIRTYLAVPLLRDGEVFGAIGMARKEVRPFTDKQIALVQTFADQAVIAIENSRLFSELQERLAEQTATAEVLASISHAPSDLQRVLDTITQSAVRLCGGDAGSIGWGEPDELRLLSRVGDSGTPGVAVGDPLRRVAGLTPARIAHATGDVFHSADVRRDERLGEDYRLASAEDGRAAVLVAPLVAAGQVRGMLFVRRHEPRAFTDRQIGLLKTFADQAVIAIENSRLFAELQERLEEQTATAEVLRVISESPTDVQPVLDVILANAMRVCLADDVMVFRRDREGFVIAAARGPIVDASPAEWAVPGTRLVLGGTTERAIQERRSVHVDDIYGPAGADYPFARASAGALGVRTILATPMLLRGEPVGAIMLRRREVNPFTERQIRLLEGFANQAAIAIENARLFQELNSSNASLKESLEQQTATSQVLQAISRSAFDLQTVLDTLAENAAKLSGADACAVWRAERDHLALWAQHGTSEALQERVKASPPGYDRSSLAGRVALDRRLVNVADVLDDRDYGLPDVQRAGGFRSCVVVPLLRGEELLGLIAVWKGRVDPFSDRQAELVATFADQAVIAIENTRLIGELRERTDALTRSVEQLRALAEVSRAISASLDPATVLRAVIERAAELSGAQGGIMVELDAAEGAMHVRAATGYGDDLVDALQSAPLRLGEGAIGRAAATRQPVQVADILVPGAYESRVRPLMERSGARALLAVPVMREDIVVGGLALSKNEPGAFPDQTVELVRTFAGHAALAIQNARLFQELAEKSRQLEEASRHKSEFLANMSHELRTPLNAVIGFTEVLLERYFGELNEKQEEYLKDVLSSGQHLLSLINDILDLSKVEAGRMELEVATFDLEHALQSGIVMVKERASRKGIDLSLEVADDVGRIEADERKVKQVLFNLLTNAVKFTPEGGRVSVSAHRTRGDVEVAVADTGVGIAPEDLPKIFDEFGQAKNQQGQTEGTGLGLALVQRLVELHGGTVRVESTVGRGSTFTLVLPTRALVAR